MEVNQKYEYSDNDELRARFTGWLDVVLYRAKLKYIRKKSQEVTTVPIDEIPERFLECQDHSFASAGQKQDDFEFEEERLARAYAELPLMRREILRFLFVEELKPDEITSRLNCSIQHVYNQRSLALKKLRQLLQEGGDKK